MQPFAWQQARSIAEAATLAGRTVAEAMLTDPAQPAAPDCVVLKAGGIDLLDLMKEGLLRPSRVVNLREVPGLDGIAEDADGLRIGALVTLEQLAAHPALRQRYTALADAAAQRGQPADPPRGDARRQPAAAAALLVFPLGGAPLRAQGRRPLLRLCRREPVPRRVRPGRLRHRASLHRRDGAGGARCPRRAGDRAGHRASGAARRLPGRTRHRHQARNGSAHWRSPHRRGVAADSGQRALRVPEAIRKTLVRLVDRRRRGGAGPRPRRTLLPRRRRIGRRRAGALARAAGRGRRWPAR